MLVGNDRGTVDLIFSPARILAVDQNQLLIGRTDSLWWPRVGIDGRHQGPLLATVHFEPRVSTDRETELERLHRKLEIEKTFRGVDRNLAKKMMPKWMDVVQSLPALNTLPTYDRLRVGMDGTICIRRYPSPEDTLADWFAIEQEGRTIGPVRMPLTARVLDVTKSEMLVSDLDSLGAATVSILSVQGH